MTANHDRDLFLKSNESSAVKIQAQWKGYKAKKEYQQGKHFNQAQLPAVIKLQFGTRVTKSL